MGLESDKDIKGKKNEVTSAKNRANKLQLWKYHFLDRSNPRTFLNQTASAQAAGYKAFKYNTFGVIGAQNFKKLRGEISQWLDEQGLSDDYVKQKLVELLDAKRTIFFAHKGKVIEEKEVADLEIQRRTADMILRIKGLYQTAQQEGNGPPPPAVIFIRAEGPLSVHQASAAELAERKKNGNAIPSEVNDVTSVP